MAYGMSYFRVIPVLLCNSEGSLVKTKKFEKPVYVGDPINAVKIFNEKEVDELIFLDISATRHNKKPNINYIRDVASESFMPLCYGGGLRSIEDIAAVIRAGIEKVSLNSILAEDANLVSRCADKFGSSATVVSVDIKKDFWGKHRVVVRNGTQKLAVQPLEYIQQLEEKGAGEVLLNSVDRDGMMGGFDLDLIRDISSQISIPLIACGGAANLIDFQKAISSGASAVAAGSMFVFQGKHQAVLISYPSQQEINDIMNNRKV